MKATSAQLRKIHVLAGERGIDNDTLHTHVFNITKKNSLKKLTITEAVNVIDSLQGSEYGRMTWRQKRFIFSLARQLRWLHENGSVDIKVLRSFIKRQTGMPTEEWLTQKAASEVIEAMKAILEKDGLKKNDKG